MIFSEEAELICFEKVHVSQTQNSEEREGKASIHKHALTGRGGWRSSMLYLHRGEIKPKCIKQASYLRQMLITMPTQQGHWTWLSLPKRCRVPPRAASRPLTAAGCKQAPSLFTNTGRKRIAEISKLTLPAVINNRFPQYDKEISGLFSMIKPLTGWHPRNKHHARTYQ